MILPLFEQVSSLHLPSSSLLPSFCLSSLV
jgi:hypothetical protein